MPTRGPLNGRGEGPSRGASEAAERLRQKMGMLRGRANRQRAEAEATRVLSHGQAPA
ncbi:MAG: hypothetical protein KGN00_05325 [Chloroflexota bacterium]|nr:hypothetical protein [Chloroflexota bacterium]MDE3193089.1 hypothetical protein [Chloroflexota bacterium]